MNDPGFFPDKGRSFERAEARRLAREARVERDRLRNERRIREQIEDHSVGVGGRVKSVHCGICGSPFGRRGKPRNACTVCELEDKQVPPGLRDKMSPEELYPDTEIEREEQ